jgi:glutamate synthase (NADPH) large chain
MQRQNDSMRGLYDAQYERDSCGIGFIANLRGNKTHDSIANALTILENMEHRGACGCENNTGDGAGILLQIPHEFFYEECIQLGFTLPEYGKYGVGAIFFPKEVTFREECRGVFIRAAAKLGLQVMGFRKVPVNRDGVGGDSLVG